MKTLDVNETHQFLNQIQLLNTVSRQLGSCTVSLSKDDPVRVAANSLLEGAEEFKHLELQIDQETFEKAQALFGDVVELQAKVQARVNTH
ncbi:hypothetical protein [Vibrio coralliilyticus]|uniref:hypothetical protein n=1 Tax=Vibrio coralliilyticus TaxID=190893 RepID=UPI001E41F69E|nr:hypothetical protein [Vibrio coralliilyticus]MCC2521049.1 hypothetical protein [Vibrio coralliilyticus]